ncbi:MAG: hypothetical protein EBS08_07610, partial [Cytophagia bacterium]|nr:hypothetical protein [Cytophagia bacterium]
MIYWLLWIFMGLAALWSSNNRQWSSSKLVSEAVGHWEQRLPLILEEAKAWKQQQELVEPADKESLQSGWDEVAWDPGGCRIQWKGNDLTSRDDKVLQNLKEDGWVKVLSGSGLAFVKDSPAGRRVAFVRLEYGYGLTTETMPLGMLVPFDGGDRLRVISPQQTKEGRPVRIQGKVWFRIHSVGRQQVSQRLEQRIFHGLMVFWLLLWALLMDVYKAKRWPVAALWVSGLMVGNAWLWGSDFGGSRFFEPVYGMGWKLWSQAGIMFNGLWMAMGVRIFCS